jgi:hypothetical protein
MIDFDIPPDDLRRLCEEAEARVKREEELHRSSGVTRAQADTESPPSTPFSDADSLPPSWHSQQRESSQPTDTPASHEPSGIWSTMKRLALALIVLGMVLAILLWLQRGVDERRIELSKQFYARSLARQERISRLQKQALALDEKDRAIRFEVILKHNSTVGIILDKEEAAAVRAGEIQRKRELSSVLSQIVQLEIEDAEDEARTFAETPVLRERLSRLREKLEKLQRE